MSRFENIDAFTGAYIECALWSTNDNSDEQGGDPLDENYSIEDIATETFEGMVADCKKFQEENADDITDGPDLSQCTTEEQSGHDFWLTRNHHGAGFWDGDWPKEAGDRLTQACKVYGEVDLYVGDDGVIW